MGVICCFFLHIRKASTFIWFFLAWTIASKNLFCWRWWLYWRTLAPPTSIRHITQKCLARKPSSQIIQSYVVLEQYYVLCSKSRTGSSSCWQSSRHVSAVSIPCFCQISKVQILQPHTFWVALTQTLQYGIRPDVLYVSCNFKPKFLALTQYQPLNARLLLLFGLEMICFLSPIELSTYKEQFLICDLKPPLAQNRIGWRESTFLCCLLEHCNECLFLQFCADIEFLVDWTLKLRRKL